jgi:hypothetical protein
VRETFARARHQLILEALQYKGYRARASKHNEGLKRLPYEHFSAK